MPVVTENPDETSEMPQMTQTIELVLKSPTDRIAPFPLVCQQGWTVRQLKLHISTVYPGRPSAHSQKVIYAGKLLADEQNIVDIFQLNSSTVVHLICQSAAVTDKDTPIDSNRTELSVGQFPDLYKEYQEYVQNFYASGSQPAASTVVPTAMTAMNQYQQMMWMNQAAYAHSCAQYMVAAAAAQCKQQSNDVAAATATANTTGVVPATVTEEHEVRQRLGREERAPRVNAGAVAVQNMMAAAFEGGDEAGADGGEAGEGEPRDALHYLYVLVRFGLLLLICYYYSSLASVLTTLVLFSLFFGVNLLRRNNQQQQPQPPAVIVNDAQDQAAASVTSLANEDGTGNPATNETVNTTDNQNPCPRNDDSEHVALPIRTAVHSTTSISQRLRQAACTSIQFVMAFFVTLFPEPIAHIDLQ